MVELTPQEQKVVQALKDLGATSEAVIKSSEQVTEKSNLPKGLVNSVLMNLVNKKIIKRVAREKSAGYCIISTEV